MNDSFTNDLTNKYVQNLTHSPIISEVSHSVIPQSKWREKSGPLGFRMCNDYLFRMLLQQDRGTLKAIIASFMHIDICEIKEVTVLNPIMPGESVDDKEIWLDINVIINSKKPINIEMQTYRREGWIERSIFYACRGYDSLDRGDLYTDNLGFWQISFCDFCLFKEQPAFYRSFVLTSNDSAHVVYSDKLMISNIDLTNIDLASEEDVRYGLTNWARLFKAQTWEELHMLAEDNKTIEQAIISAWQMTEDERIREQMRRREEGEFLWNALVKKAETAEKHADEAQKRAGEAERRADEAEAKLRELQEKLAAYETNR